MPIHRFRELNSHYHIETVPALKVVDSDGDVIVANAAEDLNKMNVSALSLLPPTAALHRSDLPFSTTTVPEAQWSSSRSGRTKSPSMNAPSRPEMEHRPRASREEPSDGGVSSQSHCLSSFAFCLLLSGGE